MNLQLAVTLFGGALLTAVAPIATAQVADITARQTLPIDITGYWVSLITDEWVLRMVTPSTGDYRYLPLNDAGRAQADSWNPADVEAAGDACKGYAAPAIMRLPSRLHITWEDSTTLRVDIDTGSQTRLFYFVPETTPSARSWQGHSVAHWNVSDYAGSTADAESGVLQVDTTNLRSGYLQKNGVPFSEDTFMTEFYNLIVADDGTEYLAVQIFIDDPTYLTDHWVRTVQFRREPNGERWMPTPCSAY
jgi:hypothetical protein